MEKACLVHLILVLVLHFSSTFANAQTTNQENNRPSPSEDASARRLLFLSSPPKPLLRESPPLIPTAEKQLASARIVSVAHVAQKYWTPPADSIIDVAARSSDDVAPAAPPKREAAQEGFEWGPALRQSFLFLAVQHGYAFTQPKTRRAIKGPFWKDYIRSVKNLHGWEDGGRFFTNYIAHPLQGSLTGFIQVQNDPRGRRLRFGRSKDYWQSRMKAMAWSAVFSTQFEIGPISQASIGNVGHSNKQTYVDLVITPTVGTALLITEDAIDRFAISWLEKRTSNAFVRITTRMILNPSRTCANLLRFKKPWHRDR